ncbi:MAG: hypothetical protein N3A72_04345 [bacterium]|nr:hypothetical protein [bacterium]
MDFFKRRLPTLIVLFLGFGMIAQYFIPLKISDSILTNVTIWIRLIAAFTLVIGIVSLMRTHYFKIKRQSSGWAYSLVLYIALVTMVIVGFARGIQSGSPFMWMFENIQVPLTASTFSLTAFFICSAAYRAFIARNFEATVMLVTAVIIMIGRIPFGDMISQSLPKFIPGFTTITSWILDVPGMAAGRAIMLGIGLGGIATSLRIILGIERTYQGKD